jgi:hypothetical protein
MSISCIQLRDHISMQLTNVVYKETCWNSVALKFPVPPPSSLIRILAFGGINLPSPLPSDLNISISLIVVSSVTRTVSLNKCELVTESLQVYLQVYFPTVSQNRLYYDSFLLLSLEVGLTCWKRRGNPFCGRKKEYNISVLQSTSH